MNPQKIVAILLLVAGVLTLAYGGFSYTKETHDAQVGPLHLSVDEKRRVNIPMWAGVGCLVVGAGLLIFGRKGS